MMTSTVRTSFHPAEQFLNRHTHQTTTFESRVTEQARQRLGGTSYQFLRFLDCRFQNGVLTLRGRVPSFYLKQMAQSILANLEGVDRIDNRVDVVSPRGLSSVR